MPAGAQTAIHEAGHVVAFIRHDLEHGDATILQDHDSAGSVLTHGKADNPADAQAKAISFCAGYASSVVSGVTEDQAVAGCGHDFELAAEIVDFWQLGSLSDWKVKAVEFMRRAENVRAVDLIAKHLLQHGTLDADYMRVLLTVSDGETTETEFAQYLKLRKFG
jgi:hypothetical protein